MSDHHPRPPLPGNIPCINELQNSLRTSEKNRPLTSQPPDYKAFIKINKKPPFCAPAQNTPNICAPAQSNRHRITNNPPTFSSFEPLKYFGFLLAFVLTFPLTLHAQTLTDLPNLALHKPATAGKSQGNNKPENAVDGNLKTRWCNGDGRAGGWWQVDLGEPTELAGCEINWEQDGIAYVCIIEGSLDGQTYTMLNDQRGGVSPKTRVQEFALPNAKARYVRITVTGLEKGAWASFTEVKLFDAAGFKKLTPPQAALFLPTAPLPENFALNKPALASSSESGRDAAQANDGDPHTRWCASDDTKPQWWEVNMEAPVNVTEISIEWERKKDYRFVVEGSEDNIEWRVLADQRQGGDPQQIQKFQFPGTRVRYLRITVNGLEDATWVSIMEVKVFGIRHSANAAP